MMCVENRCFEVRFHTHCANTTCTMTNANWDANDPGTQGYLRALADKTFDQLMTTGSAVVVICPTCTAATVASRGNAVLAITQYAVTGNSNGIILGVVGARVAHYAFKIGLSASTATRIGEITSGILGEIK